MEAATSCQHWTIIFDTNLDEYVCVECSKIVLPDDEYFDDEVGYICDRCSGTGQDWDLSECSKCDGIGYLWWL